ncbi:MAG: MFS transporter [Nitrososphaerota archaeon]|nr:MFS transporter [Candidatus Bathyarchaeota archaeon]MDW8023154.1 MFS transporter [Nitrososphaerota archaeon]
MKANLVKAESAYIAIFLMGIISLFGDVVYEGSRGIVPFYLPFLGASVFIMTFAGEFGEFLGYALRLVSGALADKTQAYWAFMFIGYGLIVSMPFLGFVNVWEMAVILVLLERIGKAVRSPSRDAVLSIVSSGVGVGKGFGFHEFLDQIGAILGPVLVSGLMFFSGNNYRQTFGFLFLPFMVLMAILLYTYRRVGKVERVEPKEVKGKIKKLGKHFYIYVFAVVLNTVGLLPYELIVYKASAVLRPENLWIAPLIYMAIQGVDAPSALFSGYSYDKFKLKVLVLPFILSIFPSILVFANADLFMLVFAAVFFGLVLGMQESIYRAAVSDFTPISSRGTAYGIFSLAYGVGRLASGVVYGLMATLAAPIIFVVLYVLVMQTAAVILLAKAYLEVKAENVKTSSV